MGLRICTSKKFSGDAVTTGPRTTLWEPAISYRARAQKMPVMSVAQVFEIWHMQKCLESSGYITPRLIKAPCSYSPSCLILDWQIHSCIQIPSVFDIQFKWHPLLEMSTIPLPPVGIRAMLNSQGILLVSASVSPWSSYYSYQFTKIMPDPLLYLM